MLRRLLLLLALAAAGCSPIVEPIESGAEVSEPRSIKVVTWNIEWLNTARFADDRRAGQMAAAKSVLERLQPDVLLAQEVADWRTMFDLVSGLNGITVAMVSKFPMASPYQRGTQEQAIASIFPIDSVWFASWRSAGKDDPPRGYSFAALTPADGHFLLVYSLHLKANGRGADAPNIAKREESARQLAEHIAAMRALYGKRGRVSVIVGGDLNTNPDDPRFSDEKTIPTLLAAGLKWSFEGIPAADKVTIPASGNFPDNSFDHVLYSSDLKLVSVEVVDGTSASDHNPVVVEFEP